MAKKKIKKKKTLISKAMDFQGTLQNNFDNVYTLADRLISCYDIEPCTLELDLKKSEKALRELLPAVEKALKTLYAFMDLLEIPHKK